MKVSKAMVVLSQQTLRSASLSTKHSTGILHAFYTTALANAIAVTLLKIALILTAAAVLTLLEMLRWSYQ
jgi:hypothetical protein